MSDPRLSSFNNLYDSLLQTTLGLKDSNIFPASPCTPSDPPSYNAVAEGEDILARLDGVNVVDPSILSSERASQFLNNLRSSELSELDASEFLRRAILISVDHPTFWRELVRSFAAWGYIC